MTNHNIPLKDKELVKRRLAQGMSTREAIKGTEIRSHQTAEVINKQNSAEISQIRQSYLALVEKFGAGDVMRAKLWAEMTKATTFYKFKIVPDWPRRKEALMYIDTLAGIAINKSEPPRNIPEEKCIPILGGISQLYDNSNQINDGKTIALLGDIKSE